MGSPSASAKISDGQSISQPQLAEVNGVMLISRFWRIFCQLPLDPVFGHEAPPSAKMVASCLAWTIFPRWWKVAQPWVLNPVQRWRVLKMTPSERSFSIQRRSRGAARIVPLTGVGKTLPLLATKVAMPRSAAQIRRAWLSNWVRIFCHWFSGIEWPLYFPKNDSQASSLVRLSPLFPAMRNLRPTDGMAS